MPLPQAETITAGTAPAAAVSSPSSLAHNLRHRPIHSTAEEFLAHTNSVQTTKDRQGDCDRDLLSSTTTMSKTTRIVQQFPYKKSLMNSTSLQKAWRSGCRRSTGDLMASKVNPEEEQHMQLFDDSTMDDDKIRFITSRCLPFRPARLRSMKVRQDECRSAPHQPRRSIVHSTDPEPRTTTSVVDAVATTGTMENVGTYRPTSVPCPSRSVMNDRKAIRLRGELYPRYSLDVISKYEVQVDIEALFDSMPRTSNAGNSILSSTRASFYSATSKQEEPCDEPRIRNVSMRTDFYAECSRCQESLQTNQSCTFPQQTDNDTMFIDHNDYAEDDPISVLSSSRMAASERGRMLRRSDPELATDGCNGTRLRSPDHVVGAVNASGVVVYKCVGCRQLMLVTSDCDLVFCPACKTLSRMDIELQ